MIALVRRRDTSSQFTIGSNYFRTDLSQFHLAIFSSTVLLDHFHNAEKQDKHCIFLGFLPLRVLTGGLRTAAILLTLSSQQQYQSRLCYTFSCSYCLPSNPIFRVQTALSMQPGKKTDKSQPAAVFVDTRVSRAGDYLFDCVAFLAVEVARDRMIRAH